LTATEERGDHDSMCAERLTLVTLLGFAAVAPGGW
jgi:hypothetical protein